VRLQLAQKIGGHLNDLRGSEEPLRLSIVLQFLHEVTSTINPQGDIKPWDIIGMFVTRLGTDLNSLLPRIQTAVEQGNLIPSERDSFSLSLTCSYTLSSFAAGFAGPWVLRADTLRADLASNAEAETRLVSQAEEIGSLLREIKTRVRVYGRYAFGA
jgi:dynactin 1